MVPPVRRLEPADRAVGRHAGSVAAAARDLLRGVTAAIASPACVIHLDVGDCLEVSELMRDVGDAVGLEHQSRPQLVLRALSSGRVIPLRAHRLERRHAPPSTASSGDAVGRRGGDRVEERMLRREQRAEHCDASPPSTSAAIQPGAALRRRLRNSTRGSRLWRRSARRRAPASGRSRDRAAGA